MATLIEVIEALKEGRSFKLDDAEGSHTLVPEGPNIIHTYLGEVDGEGFGGTADISLETLANGHWEDVGWYEITDAAQPTTT